MFLTKNKEKLEHYKDLVLDLLTNIDTSHQSINQSISGLQSLNQLERRFAAIRLALQIKATGLTPHLSENPTFLKLGDRVVLNANIFPISHLLKPSTFKPSDEQQRKCGLIFAMDASQLPDGLVFSYSAKQLKLMIDFMQMERLPDPIVSAVYVNVGELSTAVFEGEAREDEQVGDASKVIRLTVEDQEFFKYHEKGGEELQEFIQALSKYSKGKKREKKSIGFFQQFNKVKRTRKRFRIQTFTFQNKDESKFTKTDEEPKTSDTYSPTLISQFNSPPDQRRRAKSITIKRKTKSKSAWKIKRPQTPKNMGRKKLISLHSAENMSPGKVRKGKDLRKWKSMEKVRSVSRKLRGIDHKLSLGSPEKKKSRVERTGVRNRARILSDKLDENFMRNSLPLGKKAGFFMRGRARKRKKMGLHESLVREKGGRFLPGLN
jgi:hypothetical protein